MVEREFGVVISTGSGGLNLVTSIKKERIKKATSTNGVISKSVLFLGILTLGIVYKKFSIEMQWFH